MQARKLIKSLRTQATLPSGLESPLVSQMYSVEFASECWEAALPLSPLRTDQPSLACSSSSSSPLPSVSMLSSLASSLTLDLVAGQSEIELF